MVNMLPPACLAAIQKKEGADRRDTVNNVILKALASSSLERNIPFNATPS
jgi:hypothetical protein